jgi:phosphinothricin acetyltransferase
MDDLVIRAARAADLPALTQIYAHAVLTGSASFEVEPPDETEMRRRFEVLAAGHFPYLVAEQGGAVAGYGYAGPYRPRPAYRFTVEDSIYLAETARGRGIGGRLLRGLLDASEARGFRQMIAVIGDSGNEASIRLHKAAGFTLVGTFKDIGWKHGRWLDSVLMQRAPGVGAAEPPAA